MEQIVITVRPAQTSDVDQIVAVHDDSWRFAYSGVIPGVELERLIARRGPSWWLKAIRRGSGLLVLEFDGLVAGYVSFGRNRTPSAPFAGEVYELYVSPPHQGLGFGKMLFRAARRKLAQHGCRSALVWALAENDRAVSFYKAMGGETVGRSHESFGKAQCERIAFGFGEP